jgi:tetratricopeptide (TPR) repeat protein
LTVQIYKADALNAMGKLEEGLEILDKALESIKNHRNVRLKGDFPPEIASSILISSNDNEEDAEERLLVCPLSLSLFSLRLPLSSSSILSIIMIWQIQAHNNKAVILIHLSRDEEALRSLQAAIKINPSNFVHIFNR